MFLLTASVDGVQCSQVGALRQARNPTTVVRVFARVWAYRLLVRPVGLR